jgi:hypothetical protein
MTSGLQSTPENDDRRAEKPRRAETLDQPLPPHGGAADIAAAGEYIKRIPVGRLETVPQWRRLVGRIMRAMLKGDMPIENGTKLIWAARVGADMAKAEQEQRALEELNAKLGRLEGGSNNSRVVAADDLSDGELAEIASRGRPALGAPIEPGSEGL